MSRPRAILYTRVSTCGQAEHGTSLDEQFAACTKKAEQLGAQIVGHEEDAGVSGGFYTSRPDTRHRHVGSVTGKDTRPHDSEETDRPEHKKARPGPATPNIWG